MSNHNDTSVAKQANLTVLEKIYAELPNEEELLLGAFIPTIMEYYMPQAMQNNRVIFSSLRDLAKMFPEAYFMYTGTHYAHSGYTYDGCRIGAKGIKAVMKLGGAGAAYYLNTHAGEGAKQMLWPANVAGAALIELSKMHQDGNNMTMKHIATKAVIAGSSETLIVNMVLAIMDLSKISSIIKWLKTVGIALAEQYVPRIGGASGSIAFGTIEAITYSVILCSSARPVRVLMNEYIPKSTQETYAKIDLGLNMHSLFAFIGSKLPSHILNSSPIYTAGAVVLSNVILPRHDTWQENARSSILDFIKLAACKFITKDLPSSGSNLVCLAALVLIEDSAPVMTEEEAREAVELHNSLLNKTPANYQSLPEESPETISTENTSSENACSNLSVENSSICLMGQWYCSSVM